MISPVGVYTATDISTFLYCLINSPYQDEFTAGTFIAAKEAAFMIMSLTEILTEACLLSLSQSKRSDPTSHSTET